MKLLKTKKKKLFMTMDNKKRVLFILVVFLTGSFAFSNSITLQSEDGCLFSSGFGSNDAPIDNCISPELSSCNLAGEYTTMTNAQEGVEYNFISNNPDDYLTIRMGTYDDPVIGYGQHSVTATATMDGDVFVHISADEDCSSQGGCRVITAECLSCGPPDDYCEVYSTSTNEYGIKSFTTSGGVENIENMDTGGSGYS